KGRLEEERGQHLVAKQWREHVADDQGEGTPVGFEQVRRDAVRHAAHGERYGKYLGPEAGKAMQVVAPGHAPAHEQRRYERREPDGEARKNDVKGDGEGELDTGEQNSIEVHGTRFALLLSDSSPHCGAVRRPRRDRQLRRAVSRDKLCAETMLGSGALVLTCGARGLFSRELAERN